MIALLKRAPAFLGWAILLGSFFQGNVRGVVLLSEKTGIDILRCAGIALMGWAALHMVETVRSWWKS